jgi:adenosine deaminase
VYIERSVSKSQNTTAAKVTAELNTHLENPVSTKTVERELHKSNIHGTAAINEPLITENNAKRRKIWCDDHKTPTSDGWKYVI